jgi:hypothetical protein
MQKPRCIIASRRQISTLFVFPHPQFQINRMKAVIVTESGVINTWHARIAAAKLARAEADEQFAQAVQTLEAEDAAVLKVPSYRPHHPCLFTLI